MNKNHTESILIDESSDTLMKELEVAGAKAITYLARITDYRQSQQNVIYGGADILLMSTQPAILIADMTVDRIRELLKNTPKKEEAYNIELTVGRPLNIPKTRSLVYVECDNNRVGLSPWPVVAATAIEKIIIHDSVAALFKGYKEEN
ncbi:MAG: hypothetical protein KBD00_02025 [Candidatus Peribacteraceae bacterium]|nr:hypothetical protein [Candidatus Peribacteraceae bacterium]